MPTATPEQIKEWKEKYSDVWEVETEEGSVCYLRRPTRKELGFASQTSKGNPIKFSELILNTCWLAGDEEIRKDDKKFLAVSSKFDELIEVAEAEIKKL